MMYDSKRYDQRGRDCVVCVCLCVCIVGVQVDFVCELLGVRDPSMLNRGIRTNDRRKLETALKGVNVEVTHRKSNRSVSGKNGGSF